MATSDSPCRSWCAQRCKESQLSPRQTSQPPPPPQSGLAAPKDFLDQRLRVCQEIVGTEGRYCCCLRIIIDLLAQTVKASACISVKNLCLIFPRSLPRLHELHSAFLDRLEDRLSSEAASATFSSVMLHFLDANGAELLCLYRDYANDYRCALATLRKCQSRSGQLRRLLRCLQRHPSCQGLDLPAYLLTPVQRTPRYLLLLAQLRAHTPAGHPDLLGLTGAIDRLRQLLDGLDVSIHTALKQAPHHHQLHHQHHHCHQYQQQQHQPSAKHKSRKSEQLSQHLVASSCESLHRLGYFVRRRAGSCDAAFQQQLHHLQQQQHHHFLGGGQQRRDTQPELSATAAVPTGGRMGPRSRAISRQLRSADRSHSVGDTLRQTAGRTSASIIAPGSSMPPTRPPIPPAPLATWEEPQLPPPSGARRRAKSTSARPAIAIKESLRRVFLQPRRKSSVADLTDCLGTQL